MDYYLRRMTLVLSLALAALAAGLLLLWAPDAQAAAIAPGLTMASLATSAPTGGDGHMCATNSFTYPITATLSLRHSYGPRHLPLGPYDKYGFHTGVDWAAPFGIPVRAVADGYVLLTIDEWPEGAFGSGKMVHLVHEGAGCDTVYLHLHEVFVEPEQPVTAGQVIGLVGQSGAGFSHLHFEVQLGVISNQRAAIHPFTTPFVPRPAPVPPSIAVTGIFTDDTGLTALVEASSTFTDADIVGVSISVSGSITDQRTINYVDLNAMKEFIADLNDPLVNDVCIFPPDLSQSEGYRVSMAFRRLAGGPDASITAQVTDVDGTEQTQASLVGGVRVEPAEQAALVAPQEEVTFHYQVTNLGDTAETFLLKHMSAQSWPGTITPVSVTLESGESAGVTVVVQANVDRFGSADCGLLVAQAASDPHRLAAGYYRLRRDAHASIQTGSDVTGTGSRSAPFRTIGYAIDRTEAGGVLHVAQGAYTGSLTLTRAIDLLAGYPVAGGSVDWNTQVFTRNATIVDAAGGGPVVTLGSEDVTVNEGFSLSFGPTIQGFTLVNGHSPKEGGGVRLISAFAPLIHTNWVLSNTADLGGGGIYIGGGSDLTSTLVNNTISANVAHGEDGGGGIEVFVQPAVIQGNLLADNQATTGPGGGLAIMSDLGADIAENRFLGNSSVSWGGGASIYGEAAFVLRHNEFVGNSTESSGGGLFIYNPSPIHLLSNQFLDNAAGLSGGGVYVDAAAAGRAPSPVSILDNTLTGNLAGSPEGGGGGLYLVDARGAQVATNTFTANSSAGGGGGVFLYGSASTSFSANLVVGNTASGSGGGISVFGDAWPALAANQILSNTSGLSGGGVFVGGSGAMTTTLVANTIADNECPNPSAGGGGLHIDGRPAALEGNVIVDNQTSGNGGGLFLTGAASPQVVGNWISGNAAAAGGGAGIYGDASPILYDNQITDNSATDSGGGVAIAGSGPLAPQIISNTIAHNSCAGSSSGGGGLYLDARPALIEDNLVYQNQAGGGNGGGLFLTGDTPAQVLSNDVLGNTAGKAGGGIGIYGLAWPTVQENLIGGNAATATGGGLFVGGTGAQAPAIISNTIINNLSTGAGGGGGGIHVGGRPALIQGNSISGNLASSSLGGGLFLTGATNAQIVKNEIAGNGAFTGGGGLAAYDTAWPTVRENDIVDNSAGSSGGGIYLAGSGPQSTTILDNTIEGNTAGSGDGGGILISGRPAVVQGNLISGNQAISRMGGGLFLSGNTGALVVDNAVVSNSAAASGGGVAIYSGAWPTLEANEILTNTARQGGGVSLGGTGALTTNLVGNTISGNVASTASGGGILVNGRPVQIRGNTIASNQALQQTGGGISLSGNVAAQVLGNWIVDNHAGGPGGGILVRTTGATTLANNLFRHNSSPSWLPGVAILGSSPAFYHNTVVGGNLPNKIGVYVGGGGLPTITNNIVSDHYVGLYCTTAAPVTYGVHWNTADVVGCTSSNNLHADPRLADEVHLLPDSPAIDFGSAGPGVADDIDGDPRPLGSGYDSGADEFVP